MAFATENYITKQIISDYRYIRYYAELRQYDTRTSSAVKNNYPLHPCTKEEFGRFFAPESSATAEKTKRLQEDGDLFCLDWKKLDFSLYGSWRETGDYNAINVRLIPCAT